MPTYYFCSRGDEPLLHAARLEMHSLAKAKSEAMAYLVDAARDEMKTVQNRQEMTCIIRSEQGAALARISLILEVDADGARVEALEFDHTKR
jgi:hypothetical protein